MTKRSQKTLFVLDLDNTLVFGCYDGSGSAPFLFRYSEYLRVLERPYARQFIEQCRRNGDIIIFTAAMHDYAVAISGRMGIRPKYILSGEHCSYRDGRFCKTVRPEWFEQYEEIVIVDDSPDVWEKAAHETCRIIAPPRFWGCRSDDGLKNLPDMPLSVSRDIIVARTRPIKSAATHEGPATSTPK